MARLFFYISGIVSAQSDKEALKALIKFETKLKVGISYRDYLNALGNVTYEVESFLKGEEAKKTPELSSELKGAIDCSKGAAET